MIKYDRTLMKKPTKLCNDEYMREKYLDLYDGRNNVRKRWNTIKENGKRVIREYLLTLSNGCCSYCGKKINDTTMDVEHFLPSSKYPYLSYCIENLLPSCKYCNQNLKRDFFPSEIKDKKIIEECMKNHIGEYDYIYHKEIILNELCKESRIIEPTFDNIEDHLIFNPEFYSYDSKTKIGENTKNMFFNRSELEDELEKMSNLVRLIVEKGEDMTLLNSLIGIYGSEFYYRKFYEYWMNEKENNRL